MNLNARIQLTRPASFRLNVDVEIPGKGITALYGHSGSGKTTILRCLAGLERGAKGDSIVIQFGDTIWQDAAHFIPPHKRHIGFVFQDAQLLPHLSVGGNLDYAITRRQTDSGPSLNQVVEWLELGKLMHQPVTQLSGGEIQRTAIARALVSGVNLILMDEPLGAIDQEAKGRILPYLDNLHRELAIPIVYVSHLLEEITHLADRLIILERGEVIASGTVIELSSQLNLAIAHDEAAASILECTLGGHDEEYGLSKLLFDGGELIVTRLNQPAGSKARVRIPARDVSLALDPPGKTSILNIIEARIESIEAARQARLLVRLAAGSQFLLARVTRKSIEQLGLQVGQTVYAQIKSVALLTEYHHD
ncbi:MAG: molybdenum ABC transporter ATP-binding protein [Pseudomonadales bacterium]|jgi:molybdate transport system ATP-binding protein|nr:molybdenum ABC transporter ATP-binding protein [Pseudomonadales bacterium]MDP7595308.1 molybdenum ABC transporter ATP-binding protein [Pseudomonadales bacterium]HJN53268.1 molybdenum ABC transporter ATP-binding protein [Pseudomonadales bacterium]|tara:strand:+ start:1147 stop:2238 length:1092 start_codon:yes stop_codon:yes gene_type:complete